MSPLATPAAPTEAAVALNPAQRAAVEHDPQASALLVIAGAGAGKTATLAARVAWLLRHGADPQRVLLLTFSRRAAAEMTRRVGRLLAAERALPPHVPAPRLPWCGTFHAVAAALLRAEAPRLGLPHGFTLLDRGDAEDLLGLERARLGLSESRHRFPLPATCLAIHSRQVNTQQPLDALLHGQYPWLADHHAALAALLEAYGAAKRSQHALDLDDLLLAWWALMRHPASGPAIAARFDHVLVDEWQDVNRLQADLVHALRPDGLGVTAVGDDAQAIYGFRGAAVEHILRFPERCTPPARVVLLEQNYRSTPPLLAASNAVIALAPERFAKTLWTERPDHGRPRLVTVADEAAQASGVADAVLAAREQGLLLRRQAVLFRSGSHGAALELELLRRGIPFVKYGGLRFFESAHVKDVLALLRGAQNPAAALAAWRIAKLVPGLGPAHARRLLDHAGPLDAFRVPAAAAAPWRALRDALDGLRTGRSGWPHELHDALAWYRPHLERLHADAHLRWADLQQLVQVAAAQPDRVAFLAAMALDPPAASSDEARDPLLDEDYLVLSTIHSAKGQEWNAVHVLHVVDGCLPADMATRSPAELEEERRLLYVAMTRARDALTLWVPQRFHVTQQRALGDRHVYALRSRFVPDALLPCFEVAGATAPAGGLPGAAAPQGIDLMALLRGA